MGLKQVHFIDWFQAKFPMAVRSVLNQEGSQFDSVFIDVNGILHPAVRTAKNEAMFVKKLFSILDKLLTQFIPNRICYLSVDGPAPVAKMLTQKARRASKGSKGKSEGMSTLHITPGCPFMTRLEHYLSYYSVRYLQHRRLLGISPDLKFIIDHSNNPGEGESKIIENIVQQAASIRGRPCAILSMDSDAVLQAIALGMPNMYVIRKDSPFTPAIVISIDRFMNALERMFPSDSNQIRLDFCALCLFRGNDYLPGLFVGLDRLWDVYLYTKLVDPVIRQRGALRFLVSAESKTFDLFFLKQLILNSYMNPKDLRAKVSDIGRQQPIQQLQRQLKQMGLQSLNSLDQQKEVRQQKQQNISTLSPTIKEPRRSVSEYEDESDMESLDEEDDNFSVDEERDGGSDSSEDSSTDSEETSEKEGDPRHYSVKQFLDGVLWNLEMYCTGKCPDVSFCYNYRQGPPRRALVDYVNTIASISHHSNLHPRTTKDIVSIARSDKKYVHPLVCALILLPPNISAQYLPQAIAAVQTQIVPPGSSSYLTQEELEIIDLKVQTLIDILGSSDKAHDAAIAKDLSVLYTTRSPYIWTRVRCVNPRARLTLMPQNPNVIIDEANAKVSSTDAVTSSNQAPVHVFSELEIQPDILCTTVRVPPNVVQAGQSSTSSIASNHGAGAPAVTYTLWASVNRQKVITIAGTRPPANWPFFYIRGKWNLPLRQPQQQKQQQQQQQNQRQQRQQQSTASIKTTATTTTITATAIVTKATAKAKNTARGGCRPGQAQRLILPQQGKALD